MTRLYPREFMAARGLYSRSYPAALLLPRSALADGVFDRADPAFDSPGAGPGVDEARSFARTIGDEGRALGFDRDGRGAE